MTEPDSAMASGGPGTCSVSRVEEWVESCVLSVLNGITRQSCSSKQWIVVLCLVKEGGVLFLFSLF